MIRVLIADDSLLLRCILGDILRADPLIEVVGEAADGRAAVEMTRQLAPDLVIMDVQMPILDGLGAVQAIMAEHPVPILILAAISSAADAAFDAIRLGALDVLPKPAGGLGHDSFAALLRERVHLLSRVRVMHHFRPARRAAPLPPSLHSPEGPPEIVAIGASTGGPKQVMKLLKTLPAGCRATVLVVQHIAGGFAGGFADWLAQESPLPVRLAGDGEPLPAGTVLVAPADEQMRVRNRRVVLTKDGLVNCCRPSVDVLFLSLAATGLAPQCAAFLLTGMGRDGAEGLLALRQGGALTIAQDEASSAVYGMPRAAVELGAAGEVLSDEMMAARLHRLFAG